MSGETWEIREGDCLGHFETIPPGSVRLAIFDPPYNIGLDYGLGKKADRLPAGQYLDYHARRIEAVIPALADDASLWFLIDPRWGGRFQCMLEDAGLHYRETIIWQETFGVLCKGKFGRDHRPLFRFTVHPKRQVFHPDLVPSARQTEYKDKRAVKAGRIPSNVWKISRVCGTFKERHPEFPTQLPLQLVRRIVQTASDPGDLVLEPFAGSATVGVACIEAGRRYLRFELNADYARLSRMRLRVVVGPDDAALALYG